MIIFSAPEGGRVTGHEFHRTAVEPLRGVRAAWLVDGERAGFSAGPGRSRSPKPARQLHPRPLGRAPSDGAALRRRRTRLRCTNGCPHAQQRRRGTPCCAETPAISVPELSNGFAAPADIVEPDLRHHGDQDLGAGLVDLAVNVRLARPPDCLIEIINETTAQLAAYPRPDEAIGAIASAHGLPENSVLPTAGGAEAFTLIARAMQPHHPVVIHPQFTEPEAALIAAGHRPARVMTRPEDGFRLHPASVPVDADLVMIGNPTNPTSVLHPAAPSARSSVPAASSSSTRRSWTRCPRKRSP